MEIGVTTPVYFAPEAESRAAIAFIYAYIQRDIKWPSTFPDPFGLHS
jgi:hypothetical protein